MKKLIGERLLDNVELKDINREFSKRMKTKGITLKTHLDKIEPNYRSKYAVSLFKEENKRHFTDRRFFEDESNQLRKHFDREPKSNQEYFAALGFFLKQFLPDTPIRFFQPELFRLYKNAVFCDEQLFNLLLQPVMDGYHAGHLLKYLKENINPSFTLSARFKNFRYATLLKKLQPFLDDSTTVGDIESLFGIREFRKFIIWQGDTLALRYFVRYLVESGIIVSRKGKYWDVVVARFREANGDIFKRTSFTGGRELKNDETNTMIKEAIDIAANT